MTAYLYVKEGAKAPPKVRKISPKWQKRMSLTAIFLGLVLFGSATGPILSYEIFTAPRFQDPELATPLSGSREPVLGTATSSELTKVQNWFPTAPTPSSQPSQISYYTLSIPKLRIYDATVQVGGDDLSKNLVQYGGTSLPGQPGNTVIIGHSVLPQFFDPKNYMTIFSTLPTLRTGDDFYISYDGIQYRYVVEDMVEVEPTNFTILEQRFDDVFATLITCVPPGLKTKRLAVRSRLVNNAKPL